MGKHGRAAKRARLQRELEDTEASAATHEESAVDAASAASASAPPPTPDDVVSQHDLAVAARVLHALGGRLDVFASPRCKALRVAMAPLLQAQLAKTQANAGGGGGGGRSGGAVAGAIAPGGATASVPPPPPNSALIGLASEALRYSRWDDGVVHLRKIRAAGIVPKLGSVQRWVRDTDAWREDSSAPGPRWRVLDAIARACAVQPERLLQQPAGRGGGAASAAAAAVSDGSVRVHRLPLFHPASPPGVAHPLATTMAAAAAAAATTPLSSSSGAATLVERDGGDDEDDSGTATGAPSLSALAPAGGAAGPDAAGLRSNFAVVSHIPAAARQPANRYDQTIYSGRAVSLAGADTVHSSPVPGVPGAVLCSGVLSPAECASIVASADALGWVPDEVLAVGYDDGGGGGGAVGDEINAGNVVWLADAAFVDALFARLAPHLPASLRGDPIVGLNARCRLYNYGPQARYRPHLDGGWPASGMVDGVYAYDVAAAAAESAAAAAAAAHPPAWSRLTVVLYLNGGPDGAFDGGATTFFLPGEEGTLLAHGVAPTQGCVLVFPHGERMRVCAI